MTALAVISMYMFMYDTRLAMREVSVMDKEIRITGSKAVLARAAAQDLDKTPPGVLSFVREWRTRQDSNL